MVLPAEQPAEATPYYGHDESISVLVGLDHLHRFLFAQKAMRCVEALRANRHFLAGLRFNVAKPIRIRTEAVHDDNLGTVPSVRDDFQDGLMANASTAADVGQE